VGRRQGVCSLVQSHPILLVSHVIAVLVPLTGFQVWTLLVGSHRLPGPFEHAADLYRRLGPGLRTEGEGRMKRTSSLSPMEASNWQRLSTSAVVYCRTHLENLVLLLDVLDAVCEEEKGPAEWIVDRSIGARAWATRMKIVYCSCTALEPAEHGTLTAPPWKAGLAAVVGSTTKNNQGKPQVAHPMDRLTVPAARCLFLDHALWAEPTACPTISQTTAKAGGKK
jgi:hypothetical protein